MSGIAVLQNYGIEVDQDTYTSLVAKINSDQGTTLPQVVWQLAPYLLARERADGTTQQLQRELGAGRCAVIDVKVPPDFASRHLVVLTGYKTDEQGEFIEWEMSGASCICHTRCFIGCGAADGLN